MLEGPDLLHLVIQGILHVGHPLSIETDRRHRRHPDVPAGEDSTGRSTRTAVPVERMRPRQSTTALQNEKNALRRSQLTIHGHCAQCGNHNATTHAQTHLAIRVCCVTFHKRSKRPHPPLSGWSSTRSTRSWDFIGTRLQMN